MLLMLDGVDVLVMAFTASAVAAEWKRNGAQAPRCRGNVLWAPKRQSNKAYVTLPVGKVCK